MGNRPIWLFDPGWEAALDSTGARDMARLEALFLSRPWYQLVPDQKHEVVVDGLGEFRGLDYLAAARTEDGETVIAYMPNARPIAVDMTKLKGKTVRGWWFNPRTGKSNQRGTSQPAARSGSLRPAREIGCLSWMMHRATSLRRAVLGTRHETHYDFCV